MRRPRLREWQTAALELWEKAGHRGIVSVVTGGGKTFFALTCIDRLRSDTSLIVVPTTALLDQWVEETACYFDMKTEEINIIIGNRRMRAGTINIAVLNTAAKIVRDGRAMPCFLIVDECHKAASTQFRVSLNITKTASLGLSATPERPYDDGFEEVLLPELGPLLYTYTYKDAFRDGVIVPFKLYNMLFDLESETQEEYDKLTKAIGRSIKQYGFEAEKTVGLLLKRTRLMNLSLERVRLTLRLIAKHRREKIIVFHEDIEACELIQKVLLDNQVASGVYHSKMTLRDRVDALSAYRQGSVQVLVTCRALDEGFNVPEARVGIIAASTATRRQRIQRLGRVLRPSCGKEHAIVYTLVATSPEVRRLKEEEVELEGVAEVSWTRA